MGFRSFLNKFITRFRKPEPEEKPNDAPVAAHPPATPRERETPSAKNPVAPPKTEAAKASVTRHKTKPSKSTGRQAPNTLTRKSTIQLFTRRKVAEEEELLPPKISLALVRELDKANAPDKTSPDKKPPKLRARSDYINALRSADAEYWDPEDDPAERESPLSAITEHELTVKYLETDHPEERMSAGKKAKKRITKTAIKDARNSDTLFEGLEEETGKYRDEDEPVSDQSVGTHYWESMCYPDKGKTRNR